MKTLVKRLAYTFWYDEQAVLRLGLIVGAFVLATLANGGAMPIPKMPVIPIPFIEYLQPLAQWVLGSTAALAVGKGILSKDDVAHIDNGGPKP